MSKKVIYTANTTYGTVQTGGTPSLKFTGIVNGDSVIFAGSFVENVDAATATPVVLNDGGAPQALRFICREFRDSEAAIFGFTSSFNTGIYPAGEDLTTGQVTHVINFAPISYAITGVTAAAGGPFVIAGDFVFQIKDGDNFEVAGSTGNDGIYTVSGTPVYAVGPDTTTITVVETVPDGTVDGNILHSALENKMDNQPASNKVVDAWTEVSFLNNAGTLPQTLMQQQITFVQELDDGAVGISAGEKPTYIDASEIAAIYQTKLFKDQTDVDGLATPAIYDLYTVPTGKWAFPLLTIESITEVTGAVTNLYDYKLGTDSNDSLYRADAISVLAGTLKENQHIDLAGFDALTPGEIIRLTITNAATVATSIQATFIPKVVEIDAP